MVGIASWKNRDNKKYLDQLQAWRDAAGERLKKQLPQLDAASKEVLASACQAVQSADQSQKDAKAVLERLQNAKTKDAAAIQQATQALNDANQAFQDAVDSCMNVAVDAILDKDESIQALLSPDDSSLFDDSDLLLYTALSGNNCKDIARWIDDQNDEACYWAERVMAGLQNADLLRLFAASGGPRNAQYGAAIKNYHELCVGVVRDDGGKQPDDKGDDSGVLQRLALACALELADPYTFFGKQGVTDAQKRYVHYEQAYLLGELDPHFSQFNVWELRQVVNSDATEEELSWGRNSLQNYRPDIVLSTNPQWQYCMIVKTDVGYRTPDWYKNPHSYDQILSGGGKCGPRAWYGRFACKAFGIPTWGCQQPGHAAMLRWTMTGGGEWCVCLGGGIWKSFWGDQTGSDFILEVNARRACASEREFLQKVLRLQLVSAYYKEDRKMVRGKGLPDPKNLWQSLDMMQRRRLGSASNKANRAGKPMFERANIDRNRIAQTKALQDAGVIQGDPVSRDATTGAIVIPASSCSSPGPKQKKVAFLPCFTGGQQLLVQQDAEVEFTLKSADVPPGSYQLSCRVCTVHRSEEPILLTVATDGKNDPNTVHAVNMPYTVGMWQDTEPVTIEVGAATTKLHFARPKQQYGFSFKELRLVPV